MYATAWIGSTARRVFRHVYNWVCDDRIRSVFRVDFRLPAHDQPGLERFSTFDLGGTRVCGIRVGGDGDGRTCLAVECDDDAHRIVHLRRLWTTFPMLGKCAFRMSSVGEAQDGKWPLLM